MPVHLPHGEPAEVWVDLEDGGRRDVRQVDHWVPPRVIDGREVGEATFELPGDLPLGWHTLVRVTRAGTTATAPAGRHPRPARAAAGAGRTPRVRA